MTTLEAVTVGRMLILAGLGLVGIGLLFVLAARLNLPLGKLPGDIVLRRGGTMFYMPLATCLLLSVLGSVLLWLFSRR